MDADKQKSVIETDLTEFNQIRAEINSRTDISTRLVLGQISVFGLGASLIGAGKPVLSLVPAIFPGLAMMSSILWLLSLARTHQIYKLGGYIACKLAPRLRNHTGAWVLGWEEYSRLMDRMGPEAYESSHTETYVPVNVDQHRPRNIARFTGLLFAALTPILIGSDWLIIFETRHNVSKIMDILRLGATVPALLLWIFAFDQWRLVSRIKKAIDLAVVKVATSNASLF